MNRDSKIRFCHLAFCLGCIAALMDIHFVTAQTDSKETAADGAQSQVDLSKPLSWEEACKWIGTQDPALSEKIGETLRGALRSPQRSEVRACALILHAVHRGDCDAVRAALAGTRSVYPQASTETECFVARVRLWLWLTANDPKGAEYATATFRELVTHTNRGVPPKPELRAHSQLLGTVCGMLHSSLAESPISVDYLKIAEQCLSESKVSEVKSRFKQGQQFASKRAESIEQTIELVGARAPDEVAVEQADRKAKLAEMGYEFTSTRDLMIEVVRNTREASRQNTLDRRKLADYVKKLNREWLIPTAGHPGQPPIEPRKPSKSAIRVDEYESKSDGYETKKDGNGNEYREKKYKEVKRSESDIERERNQIYSGLMAEYSVYKADFDRRIAIYIPLLNSWIEADRIRRQKLQEERVAAEARSDELLESNKQLREEATDLKSEFREQRSEVEILAEKYELTDIALQALASRSISSAFRPPYFELIDVEAEKFRLLGRITK